jgi:hypothetical protein
MLKPPEVARRSIWSRITRRKPKEKVREKEKV